MKKKGEGGTALQRSVANHATDSVVAVWHRVQPIKAWPRWVERDSLILS